MAAGASQRFVFVRLSRRLFAVDRDELLGMTEAASSLLPPGLDLALWEGQCVRVIRPHGQLGLPPAQGAARGCLLMVQEGASPWSAVWAVLVDSVSREETVPARNVVGGVAGRWVRTRGKRCPVLSIRGLIAARPSAA